MKETIGNFKGVRKWMMLVDELFKGTNMIDVMQCSMDVIDGFSMVSTTLFIISTHLYEIAHDLQHTENGTLMLIETVVRGDKLRFTYPFIHGVRNERIGHKIMKPEGVVKMLHEL